MMPPEQSPQPIPPEKLREVLFAFTKDQQDFTGASDAIFFVPGILGSESQATREGFEEMGVRFDRQTIQAACNKFLDWAKTPTAKSQFDFLDPIIGIVKSNLSKDQQPTLEVNVSPSLPSHLAPTARMQPPSLSTPLAEPTQNFSQLSQSSTPPIEDDPYTSALNLARSRVELFDRLLGMVGLDNLINDLNFKRVMHAPADATPDQLEIVFLMYLGNALIIMPDTERQQAITQFQNTGKGYVIEKLKAIPTFTSF